jgi:hypothetical protein
MKPFLHGRPVQASASLYPVGNPGASPLAHAVVSGHKHGVQGPTVECVKQGEKVMRLIVTCSCGERIEVECLYPAGG